MRYEILDDSGNVINRIVASIDFVEEHYPNRFREIGDLPSDAPSDEELAYLAREKRNNLLLESDWTQLSDAPVDKASWAIYRKSLRDIPLQSGFPNSIDWPKKPT